MVNRSKTLHWSAFAFVALLITMALLLVGTLLLLFFQSVFENWHGWLKFSGAALFLIVGQWAQRYLAKHGLPWKPKKLEPPHE